MGRLAGAFPGRLRDAAVLAGAAALAGLIAFCALAGSPPSPSMQTLSRDPLDLPALRDAGLAWAARGQDARAAAILEFVARHSWRDIPTQAWRMRRRLQAGDFNGAFENADALLRQDADGKSRPVLFGLLTAAAAFVEARPALEARLAQAPWWRADFLQALGVKGDAPGALIILATLASGSTPPGPEEYAPLVNRLVARKDYVGALDAWNQIARPAPAEAAMALRDGDFVRGWDHTPFTWSVAEGVGATSETVRRSAPVRSQVLRVAYDGYSSPSLPAQLLVLPPGRYRLTWQETSDQNADQALFWRVRCADSGESLADAAGAGEALRASSPWRTRAIDVQVPTAHCAGQWLELATAPGERRAPVTAWYATMALRPAP